jgi:excisionase family DNA binding protein
VAKHSERARFSRALFSLTYSGRFAVTRERPDARHTAKPSVLPRLLSVNKVAVQLDVLEKTVRRLIADRQLPVRRVGRQLRISEIDLAAFIARSRHF